MVKGIRKDNGELLQSNRVQLFDGVGRDQEAKVMVEHKTEIVREVVEVPVVEVREIHRKLFNPKWEEEE